MTMSLNRQRNRKAISLLLTVSIFSFSAAAIAYTGEKLAKDAKIDIQTARNIALKAHPGTITDEELEKESGGSGLRYSFDIKDGGKTYEIGVDAITGKVLENKREGKHPD
jgi:uncharacterized membrane protein YkoI